MKTFMGRAFMRAAHHFTPILERANEVASAAFIMGVQTLGLIQLNNNPAMAPARVRHEQHPSQRR